MSYSSLERSRAATVKMTEALMPTQGYLIHDSLTALLTSELPARESASTRRVSRWKEG